MQKIPRGCIGTNHTKIYSHLLPHFIVMPYIVCVERDWPCRAGRMLVAQKPRFRTARAGRRESENRGFARAGAAREDTGKAGGLDVLVAACGSVNRVVVGQHQQTTRTARSALGGPQGHIRRSGPRLRSVSRGVRRFPRSQSAFGMRLRCRRKKGGVLNVEIRHLRKPTGHCFKGSKTSAPNHHLHF